MCGCAPYAISDLYMEDAGQGARFGVQITPDLSNDLLKYLKSYRYLFVAVIQSEVDGRVNFVLLVSTGLRLYIDHQLAGASHCIVKLTEVTT